jgi:hypothetical protein
MFHARRAFTLGLMTLAALALADPAVADPLIPHTERADGQLTNVVDPDPTTGLGGRMDFVGNGWASQFGKYTQVGGHDFDAFGNLAGAFTSTAADGATISGIYSGIFFPIGDGFFQFNVNAEWLVGTGRLQGVTGVGEVVAILDAETGMFHYVTDGEWSLP